MLCICLLQNVFAIESYGLVKGVSKYAHRESNLVVSITLLLCLNLFLKKWSKVDQACQQEYKRLDL
jgi:hypothetical protein